MNINLILVSLVTVFVTGCVSTPKVVQKVPTYIGTNAPATVQSPYVFSQEPVKRAIEDDGRTYKAHVREMQRMRLAHERNLALIEQQAEEQRFAEEKGLTTAPTSQPQATVMPVPTNPVGRLVRWLDTRSVPVHPASYKEASKVTVKQGRFSNSTSWVTYRETPAYSPQYYEVRSWGSSSGVSYRWP